MVRMYILTTCYGQRKIGKYSTSWCKLQYYDNTTPCVMIIHQLLYVINYNSFYTVCGVGHLSNTFVAP